MAYCDVFRSSVWFCVCLTLVIAAVTTEKECNCPGPLAHYKALNCTPVYMLGDCCAWQYNCDHLYDRLESERNKKCYLNGNEYEIGEVIARTNADLCIEVCICSNTTNCIADFNCKAVKCFTPVGPPGRLIRNVPEHDPTEEIYPNETEKMISGCKKYGTNEKYLLGEFYQSMEDRNLYCFCERNSTGEYRFSCKKLITRLDINAAVGFYNICAPVYSFADEDNTIGKIRKTWRCQIANETVIPTVHLNYTDPKKFQEEHESLSALYCPSLEMDLSGCKKSQSFEPCRLVNTEGPAGVRFNLTYRQLCRFGEMTMHIGDRLENIKHGADSCIVCTCQVPPVPTCILKENTACEEVVREERRIAKRLRKYKVLQKCVKVISSDPSLFTCRGKWKNRRVMCSMSDNKCWIDPVFI